MTLIKLIDERENIRTVVEIAKKRFADWPGGDESGLLLPNQGLPAVAKMDPETATLADIPQRAIDRWFQTKCDICEQPKAPLVRLGEEPDYDNSPSVLACKDCLGAALAVFEPPKRAFKCAKCSAPIEISEAELDRMEKENVFAKSIRRGEAVLYCRACTQAEATFRKSGVLGY